VKPAVRRLEVKMEDLEKLLERARLAPLSEADYTQLKAVLETLACLTQLLENNKITIQRLRQMLFGLTTEKTNRVFPAAPAQAAPEEAAASPSGAEAAAPKTRGHGRNGAPSYCGAARIKAPHPSLKPGDNCPKCERGKVYEVATPGVLVRVVGQAPMAATVYELQKLRCNLCLEVFTAPAPAQAGPDKYDASAASMVALLKYGNGFPFHRQERMQANLGVPMPASTAWNIVEKAARAIQSAYAELIRQAAQGEVLYNDDTTMKILALMRAGPAAEGSAEEPEDEEARRGIFTSGVVSTRAGHKIALFFTGRKHAGENLTQVLGQRAADLGPPIQMSDALSRNLPRELATLVARCNVHARRNFVDVAANFPQECRYVLDVFRDVYKNDAFCREQGLTDEERLLYHQTQSGPRMKELEDWCGEQLAQAKVEPNSGLGQAITYMQKHWQGLTLYLRKAGAPLDNNICERALKKVIQHRKNALFYKTENGAHVGDLFMTLIHTCQLHCINPFEYLIELQKHSAELKRNPAEWMPWNYRGTLERPGARADSE
jgi:transposase